MQTIKWLLLAGVLAGAGVAWSQPPASTKAPVVDEKATTPPTQAPKEPLEEALAAALRHSPEIQLAEVKLREAEVELRKTRMQVVQRVIEMQTSVEAQRIKLSAVEAAANRAVNLAQRGHASSEEVAKIKAELETVKATLRQAELAIGGLTGKLPAGLGGAMMGGGVLGGGGGMLGGAGGMGMPGMMGGGMLGGGGGGLGLLGGSGGGIGPDGAGGDPLAEPAHPPRGPMADRVRTALNTSVKMSGFEQVPLADVIGYVEQKAGGVPFLVNVADKVTKVSVSLKGELPLGAVVQALQDVLPISFHVRDYGILVTDADAAVPPGTMALLDFWRDAGKKGRGAP